MSFFSFLFFEPRSLPYCSHVEKKKYKTSLTSTGNLLSLSLSFLFGKPSSMSLGGERSNFFLSDLPSVRLAGDDERKREKWAAGGDGERDSFVIEGAKKNSPKRKKKTSTKSRQAVTFRETDRKKNVNELT